MLSRGGYQLIADQFNWLKADLIAANQNSAFEQRP